MSHEARDVLYTTNKKIRKKRLYRRKIYTLFICIIVCIVIGILSFLSKRPVLRVQSVIVEGTKTLTNDALKEAVHEKIDGSYWYIFPKNSFFFIRKNQIERYLVSKYPRIKNINIERTKTELNVFLEERTAAYLWCGRVPFGEITLNQPCYYFDAHGYIFDTAPYFSTAVYFTLYDDYEARVNTIDPIGSYVAHHEVIEPLLSFVASLQSLDIHGFALSIEENVVTLYLGRNKNEHAPRLIWNINDNYELLGSNLKSALMKEPMHTDVFGDMSKLDYIDLRYTGKVYYKLKQ